MAAEQNAPWAVEFDDPMCIALAERMRMALAEAGFPDAHVYVDPSGVFVEGVPDSVADRAFEVCDV